MRESQDCWDTRWNKISNFPSLTKAERGWRQVLLAQVVGAVVQGLGHRAVLVPHTLVSLSGCTALKLGFNSFQLLSYPQPFPKMSGASSSKTWRECGTAWLKGRLFGGLLEFLGSLVGLFKGGSCNNFQFFPFTLQVALWGFQEA